MGGISEKDINLETTTKLVGFLSSYIDCKVKCIAEECRGTAK